jgi:hypothetical protein
LSTFVGLNKYCQICLGVIGLLSTNPFARSVLSHHSALFGPNDLAYLSTILAETIIPQPIATPGKPGSDPSPFLPEPKNLKQVMKEPAIIQGTWLSAFHKEVRGFKTQQGAMIDKPNDTKKCMLNKLGMIEKLKCRIVFCGDLYNPQNPLDTRIPMPVGSHSAFSAQYVLNTK